MKKIILLLFVFVLSSFYSFSQQTDGDNKKDDIFFLGFNAGALFSTYFAGSENDNGGLGSPTSYAITYENKPTAGFIAGCFADIWFRQHFSVRLDINYTYTSHQVRYVKNVGGMSPSKSYVDYRLSGSVIQFAVLPKFTLGKKRSTYLLLGPYFDITNFVTIKGKVESSTYNFTSDTTSTTVFKDNEIKGRLQNTIGPMLAFGYNLPVKENYFCAETRVGYGFGNVVSSPNMRHFFITLNIIYQLKL